MYLLYEKMNKRGRKTKEDKNYVFKLFNFFLIMSSNTMIIFALLIVEKNLSIFRLTSVTLTKY